MKAGLRLKILMIVLMPALIIGVAAIWISETKVTELMDEEMVRQLKTSAYSGREFYESMNQESFSVEEDGTVKKGDFVITGDFGFVDAIRSGGDVYATFFYGDERIVTNVLDDKGQRMIGTKASEEVIQTVLKNGKDYFSKNVVIGGELYYGYYVPVRQSKTNEVIGIFFTGDKMSKIKEAAYAVNRAIISIIVIIIAVSVVAAVILVMGMTNALKRTVQNLEKLSDGVLKLEEEQKDVKRRDEIGEIVRATKKLKDTLTSLIGNINHTAGLLFTASADMGQVIHETTWNTEKINKSMGELSYASTQQASSTAGVSDQIAHMGDSIGHTATSVDELSKSAKVIHMSGRDTVSVLNHLDYENKNVIDSIALVYEQTNSTHEYAEKIGAVMEIIRDIAAETEMLSLNASIEAARAGEAGRGFTIVAEQVKRLAESSSKSTLEIEELIGQLNANSTAAVDTMNQVRKVIEEQSTQIGGAIASFEEVNVNIVRVSDEVNQVFNRTKEMNTARTEVVELVSELSALAEENAASTSDTSIAAEELSVAMKKMKEEMKHLHDMAENLTKDVSVFQL